MEYVIRKDDDMHTYHLPEQCATEFDRIMNKMWAGKITQDEYQDLCDELDGKFGEYMVG